MEASSAKNTKKKGKKEISSSFGRYEGLPLRLPLIRVGPNHEGRDSIGCDQGPWV